MKSMVLSCSVVSNSCDPMDYSLSGSCPWDFLDNNTGVSCQGLLNRLTL